LNEELLKEKRNIDEENFDEAIAASFRACRKTEIPHDIQQILTDPKTELTPQVTIPLLTRLLTSSHRISGSWLNVSTISSPIQI